MPNPDPVVQAIEAATGKLVAAIEATKTQLPKDAVDAATAYRKSLAGEFEVTGTTANSVSLAWNVAGPWVVDRIERSAQPDFANAQALQLAAGAFNHADGNLQANTLYYYRLVLASGNERLHYPVSVRTKA